jgi:hypothetical protein
MVGICGGMAANASHVELQKEKLATFDRQFP